MTSKEAVEKILKVLGLKSESFYEAKTEQGVDVKIDGDLELGAPIYVSTQEGMIPAPDGMHKLDDGSEIEVTDGKVSKIKMGDTPEVEEEDQEVEVEEQMAAIELEFGDVKLKDGTILRIEGDEPSVGYRVKKVGYDNTLSAIHDGEYETESGSVIQIVGGSIQGVQSVSDNEKRGTGFSASQKFMEAKDKSGMILTAPSFALGDEVKVIQEDGSAVRAKDQGYDIEVNGEPVTIFVTDGKVSKVEPQRSAEGPEDVKLQEMSEIAELFAQALKKIEDKIDLVASKQTMLEGKFMKFSNEPAGSKIYTQKTIDENLPLNIRYEGFKKLKEALASKN